MIRTILLAADLEAGSQPVLEYAFALAEKLRAVVHAVHVYPIVVVPTQDGSGSIPFQALHERALQKLRARLGDHHASPSMGKCVVDLGEPATVVREMAAELAADLIIVGTRNLRGLERVFLGSVATAILRDSPVPVLVVKPPRARPARESPAAS